MTTETTEFATSAAGRMLARQIAEVLRQNGDTTSRQLFNLLPRPHEILEAMVENGLLERVKAHYRLAASGREQL